jgi:predicted transcriptional regulator
LTRDRSQDRKLYAQKALIDWRRSQVIQLFQEGKTLNEIAEILKVDRSAVSRDYQFTRDNAADVMSMYSVETITMEVMKFLARLNAVSDEAWRMVERADKEGDNKAVLRALYLAQETTLQIVDVKSQITKCS